MTNTRWYDDSLNRAWENYKASNLEGSNHERKKPASPRTTRRQCLYNTQEKISTGPATARPTKKLPPNHPKPKPNSEHSTRLYPRPWDCILTPILATLPLSPLSHSVEVCWIQAWAAWAWPLMSAKRLKQHAFERSKQRVLLGSLVFA